MTKNILFIAAFISTSLFYYSTSFSSNINDYSKIFSKYNIQAISTPVPAIDFSLNDIHGQKNNLSNFKGKWVLLNFWATWCGPCISEIPSLENLHKAVKDKNFNVISISTDKTSSQQIKTFAEKNKITFPILLDPNGDTASKYQAFSIPLSYFISPNGYITAIVRGAKTWNDQSTFKLIEELTGIPIPTGSSGYTTDSKPVKLPANFIPPDGNVYLRSKKVETDIPFIVDVITTWNGKIGDYILAPPILDLPDHVIQKDLSAHTSNTIEKQKVIYRFKLESSKPGELNLDPVELRYTPRFESSPQSRKIKGPIIDINEKSYLFPASIIIIVILILSILFGIVIYKRKHKKSNNENTKENHKFQFDSLLNEVKNFAIEGSNIKRIEKLIEIKNLLKKYNYSDIENNNWNEVLQNLKYGGQKADTQELSRWQRQMELKIKEIFNIKDTSS